MSAKGKGRVKHSMKKKKKKCNLLFCLLIKKCSLKRIIKGLKNKKYVPKRRH